MVRSVRAFYNRSVRMEWERLVSSPYRGLEFETTMHFLGRHLPKRGLVLDAGGGPGRYTVELARRGYDIVLLDIAPANLSFARQQVKAAKQDARVKQFMKGSIVDLSKFGDKTFDAVLCLGGPLSHVVDRAKRDRAVHELIRVCKSRGMIFVSVIGKNGGIVSHLVKQSDHIALPIFGKILVSGDYLGGYGFTAQHVYLVEELEKEFAGRGVKILDIVGLEGIGSGHESEVNRFHANERLWKAWTKIHFETCTDKSVVGMSEHMLIVCRKR